MRHSVCEKKEGHRTKPVQINIIILCNPFVRKILGLAIDVGLGLFFVYLRSGTVPERFRICSGTPAVLERFQNGSGTKQKGIEPTPLASHD